MIKPESIILAVLASTGFWSMINIIIQRHYAKKDKKDSDLALLKEANLALLQDRLLHLINGYIKRGNIDINELKSLNRLYKAYRDLGGNEFIHELMDTQIKHLEIREV